MNFILHMAAHIVAEVEDLLSAVQELDEAEEEDHQLGVEAMISTETALRIQTSATPQSVRDSRMVSVHSSLKEPLLAISVRFRQPLTKIGSKPQEHKQLQPCRLLEEIYCPQ